MATRLLALVVLFGSTLAADMDSDGDGLSDYHELNKYFTDPHAADSDGDGIIDSDWHERREFTYTVRSVVKVLQPVNHDAIDDDYQDARILRNEDDYVELEVVHYPINGNAGAITETQNWVNVAADQAEFLKPGLTTNWDAEMQRDLLAELQQAGIDRNKLSDRQFVERCSQWLLDRAQYRKMFGTYFVHFPDGQPQIFPELESAFKREEGNTTLPLNEHFQHELFGRGMFYNRSYGTCTSTAIYLTTCLRAAGIPTRMVLAIPVADRADGGQLALVKNNISHRLLRPRLMRELPLGGFSAHTFNEVFVGGRWQRLNYNRLGQNIHGPGAMGMLTHVHTFNDLSEAGLTETWGWRYGRQIRNDVLGGSNPYRTVELSDRLGIHSKLDPSSIQPKTVARVTKVYWYFSDDRPEWVPADSISPNHDGHLLAHTANPGDEVQRFYSRMDKDFLLTAEGKPTVRARAERGNWAQEFYIRIPPDEFAKMEPGVLYALQPKDTTSSHRWAVDEQVTVRKQ